MVACLPQRRPWRREDGPARRPYAIPRQHYAAIDRADEGILRQKRRVARAKFLEHWKSAFPVTGEAATATGETTGGAESAARARTTISEQSSITVAIPA